MLREGDVDSNERRAVLQHDVTSNHSYAAGKTKTGSREETRGEETYTERERQAHNDGEHNHCLKSEAYCGTAAKQPCV